MWFIIIIIIFGKFSVNVIFFGIEIFIVVYRIIEYYFVGIFDYIIKWVFR